MASSAFSAFPVVRLALVLLVVSVGSSSANLSHSFYHKKCPHLFDTVKSVVRSAVSKEKRMGASLLRLHFHDCFVNGCDGSILLDDTSSFRGEKTAAPNNNSVRGFNVIDNIKSKLERACPGVVSCADIVAIAARDGVVALGGPSWDVKLGRRDSKTASFSGAGRDIPTPFDSLSQLIGKFRAKGLSTKEMVALSGSHTIGQARCLLFRRRIYNESNINSYFAKARQGRCPKTTGNGDNLLAPLDFQSPTIFDNKYYKNLVSKRGLLHSDQILYSGGSTDNIVEKYSKDGSHFASDFAAAMISMGNISPLTGSNGQIRKNCRKRN